ncbi:MAG: hypothetical protein OIN87_09920 [Candidatus Methanoperedens sp.]|nr:hypothetical protein [Candidatus Methanoperedens sp.]
MNNVSLISFKVGGFVLFGSIGLYFVTKIWTKWQKMDMDIIKARVFLNRKFLKRNWQYIFLSGASQVTHQFLDVSIFMNYAGETFLTDTISSFLELMALVFLVLLTYQWYNLILYKK